MTQQQYNSAQRADAHLLKIEIEIERIRESVDRQKTIDLYNHERTLAAIRSALENIQPQPPTK